MFTLFPGKRQDWRKLLIFPLHAFPFVVFVTYFISRVVWQPFRPRFGRDIFDDFAMILTFSCTADLILLLLVGIVQFCAGTRRSAWLSFRIGVFAAIVAAICIPNFVRA